MQGNRGRGNDGGDSRRHWFMGLRAATLRVARWLSDFRGERRSLHMQGVRDDGGVSVSQELT